MRAVLKIAPILMVVLMAGYAVAGNGTGVADHAPLEHATLERIATVALAMLLLLGLSRLHRSQ